MIGLFTNIHVLLLVKDEFNCFI